MKLATYIHPNRVIVAFSRKIPRGAGCSVVYLPSYSLLTSILPLMAVGTYRNETAQRQSGGAGADRRWANDGDPAAEKIF